MATPQISKPKSRERVYVQLRRIREDKTLSKQEKARAILEIKQEDVVLTDNPNELPMARRQAIDILSGNDRSLSEDLADAFRFCKQEGSKLVSEIKNYLMPSHSLAQNR